MNKENLANAFIDGSLSDSATSVDLKAGYVAYQPTTPYFATITPFGELSTKANSEIVEVTNKSGDTLTIVRGQRGTTAKSFSDGAIFSNGIYVEDLDIKPAIQLNAGKTAVGINKVPVAGRALDVSGDIYSNGVKVSTYRPLDYSTSEQNTGQKWIDGKAIYKRTLTGNITSAAGAYTLTTLLAPGTIDKLIDSSGYIMSGAGQPTSLMSWAGDNNSTWYLASGVFVSSSGTLTLMSMFNTARTNQPYAITVLYTKV